jgi:dihydrofolate synthase/folylpolyglutamate synthase
MAKRTYQQALDYLYSFVDYSLKPSYRYSPEVFNLERVRALLRDMGNPQERYLSIHVAGTKGKGSVSSMIASVLQAAGYRVGLYTSPHLRSLTERIRVNRQEITEEELAEGVGAIEPQVSRIPDLTTFEILTALAFRHFAEKEVQCAAVEVGLGGRLDATNVLRPIATVITSLSYDHTQILGERLSDIAREKAGIIKPGVPVVLAPQQGEAEKVVAEIAQKLGSPLIRVGRDWHFAPGGRDLSGQSLLVWSAEEQALMDAYVESAGGEEWAPARYEIPLLGHHQIVNGAVAYAALQVAKDKGIRLTEEALQEGYRTTEWPGRFQILSQSPILIVDSAHNRDSALKLRIALDDYFPGQAVTLIYGASVDKDIPGMFLELVPRISRLIVTRANHPRAADPESLLELGRSHGMRTQVAVPVAEALRLALARVRPSEVILATGSLFVVGEVMEAWDALRQPDGARESRGAP